MSITGQKLFHGLGASGRWWYDNDIAEKSLFPAIRNGSLDKWVLALLNNGQCEKTAPRMHEFLVNGNKRTLLWLEMSALAICGKPIKAGCTKLEGDTYEYTSAATTLSLVRAALRQLPQSSGCEQRSEKLRQRRPSAR